MRSLRPLLAPIALAALGASGAIAAGALAGMPPKELGHLAVFLFPSVAAALALMSVRLLRSLERERAAEAQRRDLVVAVSHDLRTPLAGLRAMVEAIDDGMVSDPATLDRYLVDTRRAVDCLVELVDDLFEFVQLDAGAIEAECDRARIEEVVRAAINACDSQAAEKRLVLETSLAGTEGVSCSPRLTRVVQNLLQNAIRHTPVDGTIRVEAHRRSKVVELVVEDSGEGIDPAVLDRIFEPFWRADGARRGEGSGLGLAVAKRIVDAIGGRIDVQSRPAHGSRFAVTLPQG